ncbi:hypothetical protein NHX12_018853, partial [Muraenolepis orangiensis]
GVRIAPHDSSVSVEEALLAVGEQLLQKKRLELSSFLQERVKGALVKFRFLELKEMDAPTPFFFNLERSVVQKKQMSCLKLPGGRVTSSPGEMRNHAMDFYTDLFGLSPEEKAALDLELTLEELTGAVNQMASGRAPGINGLSGEFLKHFWGIIGADLHAASCGLEHPLTLSAYADDVSIFVPSQRDPVREGLLGKAALYLPLADGGQGLIIIQSKIASFRLRTVSRLLYDCGPSWLNIGKLLLRSVGRFGHKQLFLLTPEELDLSGLTPLYTSSPWAVAENANLCEQWIEDSDYSLPLSAGHISDSSPKGSWRCLYKLPVEKRTADLQWRIVHGAIATNRTRVQGVGSVALLPVLQGLLRARLRVEHTYYHLMNIHAFSHMWAV